MDSVIWELIFARIAGLVLVVWKKKIGWYIPIFGDT